MSRATVIRWFASFAPVPVAVQWPERLRSCLGALVGIAFTGGAMHVLLGAGAGIPFLVAPMGASAVLLFGVPASPLAQPWSIVGGNLVSATVGVTCANWITDPVMAAALAVALAICAMFALRCVHPPSGAVALTAVLGGPAVHALGYRFVFEPIAMQSAALVCAAIVYHVVTGHRYPHGARHNADKATTAPAATTQEGFTRADLEAVLKQRGELLDIDPEDLESLLRDVQLQAYARTFSELTCADIMSHPVVAVSAATEGLAAWRLLKQHGVKALPVTDAAQHVIGIVTRADLVDKSGFDSGPGVPHLPQRRVSGQAGALVGAMMNTAVRTISVTTPIVELVPLFAHYGHHHIPVLDSGKRLVGMITQAGLISGLYRQAAAGQRNVAWLRDLDQRVADYNIMV